ncbi:MAG TPA: hypothetical protein VMT56_00350 [Candidatus Bathyarchaeia archaeon]|nr:hypothetical protein [Candidatus Bathyarchaeia archaeon]
MSVVSNISSGLGNLMGGPLGGLAKGLSNNVFGKVPSYDPKQYQQYTTGALQGNQELQGDLMAQIQGNKPDIAQQEFANALAQSKSAVASEVGGMKGLSPAAMAQLIAQGGATAAGTGAGGAALAAMKEKLGQEQMLGQLQSAAINPTLGYQQSTQATQLGGAQLGAQEAGAGLNFLGNTLTPLVNQSPAGGLTGGSEGNSTVAGGDFSGYGGGSGAPFASQGMEVGGRADVAGDSPENDKVKAMLSPGEIVLPRTVAQAEDAPERAAAFVEALKKNGGKPDKADFNSILAAHKRLGEALKRWKGGEA